MAKEKTITVPKSEYRRLKRLDSKFGRFVKYVKYLESIEEARKQVQNGETTPLSELLKEYEINED